MITALVGIVSVITLSRELSVMSQTHEEIMEIELRNRQMMSQISMYLDRHYAMVSNCVISNDAGAREGYKAREEELREKGKELILELGRRLKGGTREKLFHRVYSSYVSYISNIDTILALSGESKDVTAYYNDHTLVGFLSEIHGNIELLNDMVVAEIELTEEKMRKVIELSRMLRLVCIVVVIFMFAVCTLYSVRLSSELEAYKVRLEEELLLKNKALQDHNEHLLNLQNSIINGIATLIESRDLETGEHVQRTSEYVNMLARESKARGLYADILTDEYIERLVKAAPLHDIGKMVIPDRILLKPGRFTAEEFEEMKKHAAAGREIVSRLFRETDDREYVRIAMEVAGGHHEKWNGKGYPDGLKGDEIPVSSRIMAIADVFDALISKRHYKDSYSLDDAFGIIGESSGEHFDPLLTEIFLALRPDIEKYLSE